jgi:hypothetical protein
LTGIGVADAAADVTVVVVAAVAPAAAPNRGNVPLPKVNEGVVELLPNVGKADGVAENAGNVVAPPIAPKPVPAAGAPKLKPDPKAGVVAGAAVEAA